MSTSDAERRVESVAGSTEQKADQSPERKSLLPEASLVKASGLVRRDTHPGSDDDPGASDGSPSGSESLKAAIRAIRRRDEPIEERRLWIGEVIIRYIVARGGRMLRTPAGAAFIAVDRSVISLSKKDPRLGVFLQEQAGVIVSTAEGGTVVQILRSHALARGVQIRESPGITFADADTSSLIINLNNDRQEIVRVCPGGVEILLNGSNPYDVLLPTPTIRPITWRDVDVGAAMGLLKRLVYENLACDPSDAMFVLAFGVASPLTRLMASRILLKLSGAFGGAKSTVAAMIAKLLNGQTDPETSRLVRDLVLAANSNFILSLENLESRDITPGLLRFLLCVSTGLRLTLKKYYTTTDQVVLQPSCFTIINSIEPFFHPELLNRSFDIVVDQTKYGKVGFNHTAVLAEIEGHRDEMLSGILKMVGREILPTFAARKSAIMDYLAAKHPGHFTERSNEAIAVIALVAERLQYHFEGRSDILTMVDAWVRAQDERGRAFVAETNPLVLVFSKLGEALITLPAESSPGIYGLPVTRQELPNGAQRLAFECSSAELLGVIVSISRGVGYAHPFKNAACLSARLKNSLPALAGIGWRIRMTAKTVNGIGVHRFTFTVPPTEDELPIAPAPSADDRDAA